MLKSQQRHDRPRVPMEKERNGSRCGSHGNTILMLGLKELTVWGGRREGEILLWWINIYLWKKITAQVCFCVCVCGTDHWEANMVKTSDCGWLKIRSSSGSEEKWANRRSSTWQKSDTQTDIYLMIHCALNFTSKPDHTLLVLRYYDWWNADNFPRWQRKAHKEQRWRK